MLESTTPDIGAGAELDGKLDGNAYAYAGTGTGAVAAELEVAVSPPLFSDPTCMSESTTSATLAFFTYRKWNQKLC